METAPRSEEDSAAGGGGERRMVWWEPLLPRRRSLRVLLVESDDSTRHIVAALLRKCSYQVAAAADGMKAWEALKERRGGIDLVLSEVATPSLSGIGLLSKIMSDEECKNIPVIMMSSHDSIGVVLKCMLKGAVDFLVKPVRKNELRNLWQHVWRRHCSSGHMNASDNNAASNHISANADDRSETGENSDAGTDTQSSGSKPGVEIRSLEEHVEPELAEGRSLAKEVDRGENPDNNVMLLPTLSKMNAGGETTGKLVEVGVRNTVGSLQISVAAKLQDQNHPCDVSPYEKADVYYVRSREGEKVDLETDTQNNVPSESMQDWFNFLEPKASKRCSSFVPKKVHNENTHVQNIPNSEMPLSPSCDLSMRKPQFNGGVHKELKQRHLLNHSDSSAFSRYGDKRIHSSCQMSISSASCTRLGESVEKFQPHVNSHNPEYFRIATFPAKDSLPRVNLGEDATHLQLSCRTNKYHAGLLPPGLSREDNCLGQSSTQESSNLHPHFGFISMPVPFGATLYLGLHGGYGAFQRPMFSSGTTLSPNYSAVEKATVEIPSDKPGQDDNAFTNHLREESQGHWIPSDMDPRDKRDFPCCAMERTNQSASCMQDVFRGSGSNGSREPTDVAGNVGNTLESGNESGIQSCDREGLFSHCSRREAALLKFRSKRKDRCYEKKVRYHNRKKLAEQRPRVKGQFVRQKISEPMMATEDD